ncbi:MAG: YqgE/AlgH family protein [Hyphomicrobiaceae bacterium]|nr:YqgE/AlgH family protein [Hyphomicrobiaceae bacterium]
MAKAKKPSAAPSYLDGQLLIAMPTMTDPRFVRSVIYMCAHSEEGAMGLIINQKSPNLSFLELLGRLDIIPEGTGAALAEGALQGKPVHVGGPVETGRGFVLHSDDYRIADTTLTVTDGVCLTATVEILRAIARGGGPSRSLLALGYAGWSAGQLESELQANGWLTCPADAGLVFSDDTTTTYQRALAKLGIDPSHLVADAGHA